MVLSSGTLLIANSTDRDSGTYRCAAYNPVADVRSTSTVGHRLRVTSPGRSADGPLDPLAPNESRGPWSAVRHSTCMH